MKYLLPILVSSNRMSQKNVDTQPQIMRDVIIKQSPNKYFNNFKSY